MNEKLPESLSVSPLRIVYLKVWGKASAAMGKPLSMENIAEVYKNLEPQPQGKAFIQFLVEYEVVPEWKESEGVGELHFLPSILPENHKKLQEFIGEIMPDIDFVGANNPPYFQMSTSLAERIFGKEYFETLGNTVRKISNTDFGYQLGISPHTFHHIGKQGEFFLTDGREGSVTVFIGQARHGVKRVQSQAPTTLVALSN